MIPVGAPPFQTLASMVGGLVGLSPWVGFLIIGVGAIASRVLWDFAMFHLEEKFIPYRKVDKADSWFIKTLKNFVFGAGERSDFFIETDSWVLRTFVAYFTLLPLKFVIEAYFPALVPAILPLYIALPVAALAWPYIADVVNFFNHKYELNQCIKSGLVAYKVPQKVEYNIFKLHHDLKGYYYFRFGLFSGVGIVTTILLFDPTALGLFGATSIVLLTGVVGQLSNPILALGTKLYSAYLQHRHDVRVGNVPREPIVFGDPAQEKAFSEPSFIGSTLDSVCWNWFGSNKSVELPSASYEIVSGPQL